MCFGPTCAQVFSIGRPVDALRLETDATLSLGVSRNTRTRVRPEMIPVVVVQQQHFRFIVTSNGVLCHNFLAQSINCARTGRRFTSFSISDHLSPSTFLSPPLSLSLVFCLSLSILVVLSSSPPFPLHFSLHPLHPLSLFPSFIRQQSASSSRNYSKTLLHFIASNRKTMRGLCLVSVSHRRFQPMLNRICSKTE